MTPRAKDALKYEQITDLSAAVGITPAAGSETVVLQCETQNVRYRDDGSDPTGTVGMVLVANTMYEFTVAQIARMKFIEAAASAVLNVSYYGRKTA